MVSGLPISVPPSRCRALSVGIVLCLLATGNARADIPNASIYSSCTDDNRVRLDAEFGFKGLGGPDCDVSITRIPYGTTDGTPVFDGDLGLAELSCACSLLPNAPPPDEDATGRPCVQYGDGWYDASSSCPDSFVCWCHRFCNPAYDTPPSGDYFYHLEPNGSFYFTPRADCWMSVDWSSGTCEGTPPPERPDAGPPTQLDAGPSVTPVTPDAEPETWADNGSGCDCSTGDPRPHLLVLLIFCLGAAVPLVLRSRRRK